MLEAGGWAEWGRQTLEPSPQLACPFLNVPEGSFWAFQGKKESFISFVSDLLNRIKIN